VKATLSACAMEPWSLQRNGSRRNARFRHESRASRPNVGTASSLSSEPSTFVLSTILPDFTFTSLMKR
jgi:hypothetical protein